MTEGGLIYSKNRCKECKFKNISFGMMKIYQNSEHESNLTFEILMEDFDVDIKGVSDKNLTVWFYSALFIKFPGEIFIFPEN